MNREFPINIILDLVDEFGYCFCFCSSKLCINGMLYCRCNYINFRKNMVCLKCDHRRPKASNSRGSCAQAVNDNGDNRLSRPYFGEERRSGDASTDRWNFVQAESENEISSNSMNEPRLFDFPIAGGKSSVSQNLQKQASWKQEMAERSKNAIRAKENADDFKSAIMQRRSEFLEPTDDEDMAEWFGVKGSKGR